MMNSRYSIFLMAVLFAGMTVPSCNRDSTSRKPEESRRLPKEIQADPSVIQSDKVLDYLIDKVRVSDFEAMDISMNEATSKIEKVLNEVTGSDKRRISIINRNSGELKVTIVLKNVRVRTLLDLISDQTLYSYRVDNSGLQILYFSTEDFIGNDPTGDEPDVLEPP